MLLAPGWQHAYGVPDDVIAGAFPISGLFDLTPIPATHINAWARLDADSALRLSPLFHLPSSAGPLLACVGENETDEFKRQSACYVEAWRARGLVANYLEIKACNHFDVVLELGKPDSALALVMLRTMGLDQTDPIKLAGAPAVHSTICTGV